MIKKIFSDDDLWQLVHRMTPAEQRYFKVFASRHSEKKELSYLQLFDLLLEQQQFDDQQLHNVWKNGSLAAAKNYLSRTLLQSLRTYHDGKDIELVIRDLQKNAAILRQKRLYSACENELTRATGIAKMHEQYTLLVELHKLRIDILLEHHDRNTTQNLEEAYHELHHTRERYVLQLHLQELSDRIFHLSRAHYQLREDERKKEIQRLYQEVTETSIPGDSLLLFHLKQKARATAQVATGEFPEAATIYRALLLRWEEYPDRIEADRNVYRKLLSNYLVICHSMGDFKNMRRSLDQLHQLPAETPEEEAEHFQNAYYLELLYLLNNDEYSRLDNLATTIINGLTKYKTKINKARELAFCHNLSMAYFLLHDWKKSLAWLERIIVFEKTEHRQDLQHTARMLRLVLWYELGKHDLLEYELVNVERFLRKRKAWFAYESTVVKFFGKLTHADKAEQKELTEKFSAKLAEAVEGKTSAALPGSSELSYWAKSKLSGKTMRELLREE